MRQKVLKDCKNQEIYMIRKELGDHKFNYNQNINKTKTLNQLLKKIKIQSKNQFLIQHLKVELIKTKV